MELAIAAVVVVVIVALLIFKNSAVKGLEVLDVSKNGRASSDNVSAAVTDVKHSVNRPLRTATRAEAQVKK